jgi:hypothetical protein
MVKTNKNILRGVLILSYVIVTAILLFLISLLLSYLNTGADRSTMLHTEVKKIDQYLPKIIWTEDGNIGRVIDKQTLAEVENDYIDAWYIKQIAYKTNLKTGIDDYYTDSARKNLHSFITINKKENITIDATTLAHNPNIDFFSEDGQLIVLKDENVVEYKKIYQNDKFVTETTEISTYKAILLLEDGFWRLRHLIKESSANFNKTIAPTLINATNIKGINYYPQATPWNMFGDDFDIKVIQKDFEILKTAGLNTIRIFIQYEDFGKANVKESKLKKLQEVLDAAEKNDINVIVTLFDFYGNYEVLDWTLNQRHAETIVFKFKNHNAILAWDIKNEPNLDFKSRKKENVLPWLEHMIIYIKSIDKKHAVTIGWSNTESAPILKNMVDFVSFHYYEDKDDFEKEYQLLKKTITNKPIFLGEFGVTSYDGFWKPIGSSKEKQATYYKEMQKVLSKNKIPFLSWTLYDFNEVPKSVVGKLPWRVNPQKEFGFLDINGNKKPAFKFISK